MMIMTSSRDHPSIDGSAHQLAAETASERSLRLAARWKRYRQAIAARIPGLAPALPKLVRE